MKSIFKNLINKNFLLNENLQYIIKNILIVFLGVFISATYILIYNINHEVTKSKNTLSTLSNTYDGYIDKDIFCKSIGCAYIGNVNTNTILDVDLFNVYDINKNAISLGNIHYIKHFYYGIKYGDDIYYLDITDILYNILYSTLFILLAYLVTIFSIVSKTIEDKNLLSMDLLKNSESINKYETLNGLVSNINHELSTPLNVINSVFEDFKYTNKEFSDYIKNNNDLPNACKICDNSSGIMHIVKEHLKVSQESIELGILSVRQMYDELNTINDYKKTIKNNNETVYDLLIMSVKLLNKVSVIDINKCTVDPIFKELKIDESINMPNMLFVSMVINHLKNSIEANANKINITLVNDCINIEDNGNGVSKDVEKHIFENDFTTKDTPSALRGNGLYINKLLLKNKYSGDIVLVKSIPNVSTVFCLKVKLKRINNG